MIKYIIFEGIKFRNFENLNFSNIIKNKGLFVFPSGPGLSTLYEDAEYYKSLKNADYVFLDSGYFVILLKIFKLISLNKFSGYLFIEKLIQHLKINSNIRIFSIDPNKLLSLSNRKFLIKCGLKRKNIFNYVAPNYKSKSIRDSKVLKLIKSKKPEIVLINLGGGTQEILGMYLNKSLKKKIRIFCTGAAISFFTGDQAPISKIVDKIFLGWLVRIIYNPKIFFIRYFNSFKLFFLVLKSNIKIN